MRRIGVGLVVVCLAAVAFGPASAVEGIALKSGETADIGTVFWVAECKSLLRGEPTVEIMEGPPDVAVSVRQEKVTPHNHNCAKPVPGGTLVVTAPKEIKARVEGKLTLRIKYPTLDGMRQSSRQFDVTLFP